MKRELVTLGGVCLAAAAWGHFEAGWVRLRRLELSLPGLPRELDGLRIVHLSDFHFGVPSPGVGAAWRAAVWARERRPDLVAITGDLLTHPRGETMLRRLVRVLPGPTVAVLGNHDLAISRDPQARRSDLQELEPHSPVASGHADRAPSREWAVRQSPHSFDFPRRVRGVAREDLRRDRRLTGHYSTKVSPVSA